MPAPAIHSPSVVIAGAGIAGAAAAVLLAQRGFRVTVLERAKVLETVGSGLQLTPNACRILSACHALENIKPHATEASAIRLSELASGDCLLSMPISSPEIKRWGAPYLVVHRADLQQALIASVTAEPQIRLVLGATVTHVEQSDNRAMISYSTDDGEHATEADLLVGADGAWSAVRAHVGAEPPRPNGTIAWRLMIDSHSVAGAQIAEIADGRRTVTCFTGARGHVVVYPVRGGSEFNIVAVTADTGSKAKLPDFEELLGCAHPAFKLLETDPKWLPWPIVESSPGAAWAKGRVILIGDAAHAMPPHAAQGAGMALEDAGALAIIADSCRDDLAAVASRFEIARRKRVEAVMRRGAINNWSWHVSGLLRLGRDMLFRLRGGKAFLADLDWLYCHDAMSK